MKRQGSRFSLSALSALFVAALFAVAPAAHADDTEALAKAAQNPIAAMISLPFQNNKLLFPE